MELKHTPGPWQYLAKLSGSENHKGFRIVCERRDGWWIADTSPIDQDGTEGEANARLIAAAPDLLAACLKARPAVIHQLTLWKELRQAIIKATGEELLRD